MSLKKPKEMNTWYQLLLEKFFHSESIEEYSLEKMTLACEYFGNPQNSFKSIHIAGTNGKWSVSKMIFQILKESGKRVWVYTSPHNIDIRERFENENWLISEDDFMNYAEMIIAYWGWLSYYEKCVLMAFLHFRDTRCEYAVIEVGMWGRLDATNIITPILSAITSISYDHMEFLGDTLQDIAREKWGIIKPWVPILLYDENPTLQSLAIDKGSPVIFPEKREITTNLLGDHQIANARIAYEAGKFLGISDSIIQQALLHVDHHGRLEYIRPNLLIDGAHNEDGMRKLHEYLEWEYHRWEQTVYSFNLKKGKSPTLVLSVFPEVYSWNVVDSHGFRVNDASEMQIEIEKLWKEANILSSDAIFELASKNPKILFVVFGSLFMMKEFLMV